MNAQNAKIIDELLAAIAELEVGSVTIVDVQATLQSAVSRFENDGSGVIDAVRLAEADIEEIQFTMLLDEQLPAVTFRLDELRSAVEDDGDG